MPGDPKECRHHAYNCMLLAKQATTAESKQTFHNLAQSWTRLATELEQAQVLLKALNGVEFKPSPDKVTSKGSPRDGGSEAAAPRKKKPRRMAHAGASS